MYWYLFMGRVAFCRVPFLLLSSPIFFKPQLSYAQSDEVQALDPDTLPECETICGSYHLQMVAGACPKTESSDNTYVARCMCADKENMEWYAACVGRTCSDAEGVSVDDVLGKAYSQMEENCVSMQEDIALSRDEFLGQGGVQRGASATGTATASASTDVTVEDSDPASAPGPARTTPSSTETTIGETGDITAQSTESLSSATSPPAGEGGLSTSDKIAIGVGLGVGIPTMLITLLTFLVTCRWRIPWSEVFKRKKPKLEGDAERKSLGRTANVETPAISR